MSEVIMKRNMFEEFNICTKELIEALEKFNVTISATAVQKEVVTLSISQKRWWIGWSHKRVWKNSEFTGSSHYVKMSFGKKIIHKP